jgi:hypothetical protein
LRLRIEGGSERHSQFFGARKKKAFPTLKAPKLCQIILLVEASLGEGRALGNEEGKNLGSVRESTEKK